MSAQTFETDAKRGVLNHYGVRTTKQRYGGEIDDDVLKVAAWTFSYDDLPVGGTDKLGLSIPAYSKIVSAYIEILTGFTSTSTTTDLDIGFEQADGTDIDLDGLFTASVLTQTAIATRGNTYVGAGALIGASIGTAAGELVVTPSAADLTAGKARIIVRYFKEGV